MAAKMFYDMHTHTSFSHDSVQDPEGSCLAAIEKGLRGIAFTDHADTWYFKERNTRKHIEDSLRTAGELNDKFGDRLKVIRGVEIGDSYFDRMVTAELVFDQSPDVVIGSIHCLSYGGLSDAYSCVNFDSTAMSRENLLGVMDKYFELVADMAENDDYDILAHLNCPFRYINGKYGRGLRSEEFEGQIKNVLSTVISRKRALEVNTSGMGTPFDSTMPDRTVLGWYKEMGGELITLGSDAHTAERVGNGFRETADMLRSMGFTHYAYYEARTPHRIELPN